MRVGDSFILCYTGTAYLKVRKGGRRGKKRRWGRRARRRLHMKYRHVGGEHGCNYRWRGHLPEPPLGEFLSSVPSFPSDRLRYAPRAPGAAVAPRGSPAARDGTPAPPPPQRRPGGLGVRQGGSGVCTARPDPSAESGHRASPNAPSSPNCPQQHRG